MDNDAFVERVLGYTGGFLFGSGIGGFGYVLYRLYSVNRDWTQPVTLGLLLVSIAALLLSRVLFWIREGVRIRREV